MKWKALLSLAVLAAALLPQAAWSRNHHLLDITNTPTSGVLNNITHSGSGILNNPLSNSGSSLFHNSLIGSATNNGLVQNTLNNGSGLFHRKRHRGLLAWIRNLLFGSSNNNLGTFGNKNYQSYSGSIFNNNSKSILNSGGGVRGFFNRI